MSGAADATTASFFFDIERFGRSIALRSAQGDVTFSDLAERSDAIGEQLAGYRKLVFLEAANTVDAIAAYLACLRAGHPVYLFSADNARQTEELSGTYHPDAVIRTSSGSLVIEPSPQAARVFHPDLRVLLATSGSTGSPKFVKLSAANLESNASSIAQYLELGPADRALTSLKFNYSFGMSIVNSHFAVGGSLILTDHSVADREFWQLCERHAATSFSGVPFTFELLDRIGEEWAASRSLKYVTQAGGRLPPESVVRFSKLGTRHGWRFFVMYGQSEAAPRMAYLPPESAIEFPDCIGVPIPGGRFSILDEDGRAVDGEEPGELAYAGPNIMMGYAYSPDDLATDETPPLLLTGDIACRNAEGLYRIVGRRARFLKPFGIRLNLDDLESDLRKEIPDALCTGTDERIVLASAEATEQQLSDAAGDLANRYGLPVHLFLSRAMEALPRLSNGKPDYRALLAPVKNLDVPKRSFWRILLSRQYALQVVEEAKEILGLGSPKNSVSEIFQIFTGAEVVSEQDSFRDLGGDSMSYIQASLALEEYLGSLPQDWEAMAIGDLEQRRANAAAL